MLAEPIKFARWTSDFRRTHLNYCQRVTTYSHRVTTYCHRLTNYCHRLTTQLQLTNISFHIKLLLPAQVFVLYGKLRQNLVWMGQQGFLHTEWRTNMYTYNYITINSKISNKINLISTKHYVNTLRKRYTNRSLRNMSVQVRCLLEFPRKRMKLL